MRLYNSKEVRFSNVVSLAVGAVALYHVATAAIAYGYTFLPTETQHKIEAFFTGNREGTSSGLENVTRE